MDTAYANARIPYYALLMESCRTLRHTEDVKQAQTAKQDAKELQRAMQHLNGVVMLHRACVATSRPCPTQGDLSRP